MERRIVLTTDDEDEAFRELMTRRAAAGYGKFDVRYRGWDMARVAEMTDPPKTAHIFCVFQIEENK